MKTGKRRLQKETGQDGKVTSSICSTKNNEFTKKESIKSRQTNTCKKTRLDAKSSPDIGGNRGQANRRDTVKKLYFFLLLFDPTSINNITLLVILINIQG